jgi:2-isopropylmalate synthase
MKGIKNMRKIVISDVTLRQGTTKNSNTLSFKEKIEITKQLDKLNLNIIETAPISEATAKADILFLHTIAPIIKNSIISSPVACVEGSAKKTYDAIKAARFPRLSVSVPVSPVQMEFICKMKPPFVLQKIKEIVGEASSVCSDVEYIAEDATRSEKPFLYSAISTAIEAGATTVTICEKYKSCCFMYK